jgi:hypothetical protein
MIYGHQDKIFSEHNIRTSTYTSAVGKDSQPDEHVFIDRRWYSGDKWSDRENLRANDCYVVVKNVMEILSGYKRKTQKFDVDRFELQRPLIWTLKNSIRFLSEEGLQLW